MTWNPRLSVHRSPSVPNICYSPMQGHSYRCSISIIQHIRPRRHSNIMTTSICSTWRSRKCRFCIFRTRSWVALLPWLRLRVQVRVRARRHWPPQKLPSSPTCVSIYISDLQIFLLNICVTIPRYHSVLYPNRCFYLYSWYLSLGQSHSNPPARLNQYHLYVS